MISRRFLLSAAPCALVAASAPIALSPITGKSVIQTAAEALGGPLDRARWFSQGLGAGLFTVDEVRKMEGLP